MKTENIMKIWNEFNPTSSKSIKSDFQEQPSMYKNEIISYLRNGKLVLASPERRIDLVTGKSMPQTKAIFTDGEFSWSDALIYYVDHYNLRLPAEFEIKIIDKIYENIHRSILL